MEHQPSQTSGTGAPEQALGEAEGIARMFLDSIPGMVALLTPSGEVEFVNNQILEYCGKTLGELKQWGTNDTIHPDDLPGVIGAFTGSITSGKPYEITQRLRRFDGAYRWFQNSGFPLRDTDARILHWCVLLTDVHERNGAEEALRQSEARLVEAKRELQLTVDTIPALAWSARPDGSADFFNQHYLEYVGLPLEEVRDWRWTAAVHPDDLGGLARAWERILDAKAGGEAEARLRRSDGVYRWFLLRAQPLRDEKDNIVRWYGINTDIEDRKGAEAELRRAYDSFADAQRLSRTGSFITDLVADDHNWSDEAFRIFEFEPKSKVTVQRIRAMVHPDDLASFDSVIERGSKAEEVDFFFRILTSRGPVKHVPGPAHCF